MKITTLTSLFVLLSVVSMITIAPNAFADHTEVTIEGVIGAGSDQGCDETDTCWSTGRAVSIAVGGEITFLNTDNMPHSLSSGTQAEATDYWPVVLVMQPIDGNVQSQSFTLDSAGEYPFFCMVHAWMIGTITVEDEVAAEAETAAAEAEAEAEAEAAAAADAAAMAAPSIDAADYISASGASVTSITANADDDSVIIAIDATNDGVLSVTLHSEVITAFDDGTYFVLIDNASVEFEQTGNSLTIPYEAGNEMVDIVGSHAVPEFGTIAMIILAVAIVSIIAITAKTRTTLIPKL